MNHIAPIGVFDSGYGGLTILKEIVKTLPAYDYIYLGDNARAPYGTRSFDTVYHYTLQCVKWLFEQGCPLVILACNTASAKALRTIQQNDLPVINPQNRVLGVIRPTSEVIGSYTKTKQVGILATKGTVQSQSYQLEIAKIYPDINVTQHACPLWVPLIENNAYDNAGADYFISNDVQQLLDKQADIDVILLACTHYPILKEKIKQYTPEGITVLPQGEIIADSLADYLQRHPEMAARLSLHGQTSFYTTDDTENFDQQGSLFFGKKVHSKHVSL